MTRKQAITIAISALRSNNADEAATVLENMMKDLPMCHWSEATCYDAIDQWILDKGKLPTIKQFDKYRELPAHPTIQNRFGITLAEFLKTKYDTKYVRVLHGKAMDEWRIHFIEDYNRIQPTSAEEYNLKRTAMTPQWRTIAKAFGVGKWGELLKCFDLQPFYNLPQTPTLKEFSVVEIGGVAEYDRRIAEE